MAKKRLSTGIPREWTPTTAEIIQAEFDRIYYQLRPLPVGIVDFPIPTPGAVLYGDQAGSPRWVTLPIVTTAQRVIANTNGVPAWAQVDLTLGVTGTLPATNGGTGTATVAVGDLLYGSAVNTWSKLAKNTSATRYLSNTGAANIPAWAQVSLTTGVTGTLPVGNGGTGLTTFAQGDLIYGSAANVLSALAKDASATRYLSNTGATNNPAWAQVALATGVSGILPNANGGTGLSAAAVTDGQLLIGKTSDHSLNLASLTAGANITITPGAASISIATTAPGTNALLDGANHTDTLAGAVVRGDVIVGNLTPKWARLSIGTVGKHLRSDGTDAGWSLVVLTSDVSGTLPVTNGGTGLATATQGDLLYGSAANTYAALAKATVGYQVLTNQGATNNPAWAAALEVLSADRTYYVRTDGSDSNTGLADTAGGAFLTIQKAIDTVSILSVSTFTVTIQVRTGTYAAVQLKGFTGIAGKAVLLGDETTPSNVVIDNTTAATHCVRHNTSVKSYWKISGFKLTNSGSGSSDGISLFDSFLEVGVLALGAITRYAFNVNNARVQNTGNLTFSGNTQIGIFGQGNAVWNQGAALTYTFSGTPAWSGQFVYAVGPCYLGFFSTMSGGATGKRYVAELNGVINTFGGGANYFPGNVAGTTATGGQYN